MDSRRSAGQWCAAIPDAGPGQRRLGRIHAAFLGAAGIAFVLAVVGCGGQSGDRSPGRRIFDSICTNCHVIGQADSTPRIVLGPGLTRSHIVNMVETGHHVIAASERLSRLSPQDVAAVADYVVSANRQRTH